MASGRPSMTRFMPSSNISPAMPPLLASVIFARCGLSTRPTSVSFAPKPYSAAVSNIVTPRSSARSSSLSLSSGGGGAP